jgi:NADH-quinone oxidoreductase subunit F
MTKLTPVLSAFWDQKDSFTIEGYKRNGGYKAIEKALSMAPDDVIKTVKDSGLRGRGGAGFPTGMKWGFIPQGDNKEHYFVVNADESEPGTCKDTPLLMANPHVLIEGIIIGSYAIRANYAFIYIRGEIAHVVRRVQQAIEDAYKAGYLGKNILGKGFDLELVLVHTFVVKRLRFLIHLKDSAVSQDFGHRSQPLLVFMRAQLLLITSSPLHQFLQ